MQPKETRTCTLCGTPGARLLFVSETHQFVALRQPYAYYACDTCGVHELETSTLPEDLYLVEKEATVAASTDGRRYVHFDDDVVRALRKYVPFGRFLDVGSGYGDMLRAASAAGYEAEGVDVSPVFAERARGRSGRPVFVGSLLDARFPDGRFSVVNAHFVLEYVPNLREVVREVRRVLAPGGVFRVFGFVTDSLPARLRGGRWWNYTPTRLRLLSNATIRYLAADAGLHLEAVVQGGEQSLRSALSERPAVERSLSTRLWDATRHFVHRIPLGGWAPGSCRAFYLRRPA